MNWKDALKGYVMQFFNGKGFVRQHGYNVSIPGHAPLSGLRPTPRAAERAAEKALEKISGR